MGIQKDYSISLAPAGARLYALLRVGAGLRPVSTILRAAPGVEKEKAAAVHSAAAFLYDIKSATWQKPAGF